MPRYELSDGSTTKFWEATLDGATLTTRWGKVGGIGHQLRTKTFADEAAARKALAKQIAEKVGQSFTLVEEAAARKKPAAKDKPAAKSEAAAKVKPAARSAPSAKAGKPAARREPAAKASKPARAAATEAPAAPPAEKPVPLDRLKVTELRAQQPRGAYLGCAIVHEHLVLMAGGAWGRVGLLASTNGRDFYPRPTPPANGLRNGWLRDDGSFWLVGEYGLVAVSRDRGASWRKVKTPASSCLFDLGQDARGTWWIAGDEGVVLRSTSKGKTWTQAETPLAGRLLHLHRRGDDLFFLGKTVTRWDGDRWNKVKGITTSSLLCDMVETPAGTLVVVGDAGVVYRSTDDGRSFSRVDPKTRAELEAAAWVAGALFVVGSDGTILRSVDDGLTFKKVSSGTRAHLWSIASWGTGAVIGGDGGLVLRLETPEDHYWDGAVDEYNQPIVPVDFTPPPVDPAELERRHQALLAEAQEAHAELSGKAAARPRPDPDHDRSILAAPDEPEPYLVYGDVLQDRGDPRGELVALQQPPGGARERKPTKEERALLARHAETLLPGLQGLEDLLQLDWRWGFIRAARLASTYQRHEATEPQVSLEEVLGRLLDLDSARYLRELTVGIVTFEDNDYSGIAQVIGERHLPALASLFLGDFDSEETELNWSSIGAAGPIWRATPNLERLTLRSGSMALGELVLPRLRELTTITGGMSSDAVASIARGRCPSLERLSLQFGRPSYGCDVALDDLQPILEGGALPRLVHLGLTNCELTDGLCARLPRAPILPQLRELDLSLGTLSDEGARILAAHRAALAHLELLDVRDNFLTDRGAKLLEGLCGRVEIGPQRDDGGDPSNRYASAVE